MRGSQPTKDRWMDGSQAVVSFDRQLTPANANHEDPWPRLAQLEADLEAQEPVIGAAILVATSFRLRDEASLVDTLRLLAQAVHGLEQRSARED
jgi:hypothetical protein